MNKPEIEWAPYDSPVLQLELELEFSSLLSKLGTPLSKLARGDEVKVKKKEEENPRDFSNLLGIWAVTKNHIWQMFVIIAAQSRMLV